MPKREPHPTPEESATNISSDSPLPAEPAAPTAFEGGLRVTVYDQDKVRRARIGQLIADCGALPVGLDALENLAAVRQSATHRSCCLIAVMALGEWPGQPDGGIEAVHRLKQAGVKIIAYEDGARAWPLGLQCQALLSGALWLLDSARADFEAELSGCLSHLLRAESERVAAEIMIKDQMRRLGLIGQSEDMLCVFRQVARISALSDLATLITGETGTGKELLACALHQLDPKRCHGPFVAINCGAINPGVAESELFGHRRGAFTGAAANRAGLIRSADGGVLFLDEVGELDAGLQTKLLRVLQESRVLGMGEDRESQISVRIVAATNRDLSEMVREGRFRADLFHRLNLLTIHVPPLRERPSDMRPLIEHFLHKHQSLHPAARFVVGDDFVAALTLVELSGNVRQLENIVRWVIANKDDGGPLNLSDLPQEVWEQVVGRSKAIFSPAHPADSQKAGSICEDCGQSELRAQLTEVMNTSGWNLAQSLEYCERLMLESALHLSHGNQTQTAKLLGLTPRSVYNKVRKHHLAH